MVRLSVGVPAYNQAQYLRTTLASLLDQEVAPHEIVVSNNHSTDGTADVLAEFAGAVRVVQPPEHLPPLVHWDWVVGQLEGDWFALLSSDDVARPSFCRVLSGAADEGVSLVHGGYEIIDEVGERVEVGVSMRTRPVRTAPDTLREQLVGPIVNLAAFAARRADWEELGGFSGSCELLGDWALWLQLVPRGRFVYDPTLISGYRVYHGPSRPGELHWRVLPSTRDLVTIYDELIPAIAREVGVGDNEVAKAARTRLRRHLGQATGQLPPEERAGVADVLRPLAARLGCEDMVDTFAASGLEEEPYFRFDRVRRIARPILDRVRAVRAGAGR
jgi:hypothetical protein